MSEPDIASVQEALCRRFGAEPHPTPGDLKVGIAPNVREGLLPINGLRIQPGGDTTGWYIWAGEEMSDDPDFFIPLHAVHLAQWCPAVLPYLLLPPGWHFQVAPGHEDVWFVPETATHRPV